MTLSCSAGSSPESAVPGRLLASPIGRPITARPAATCNGPRIATSFPVGPVLAGRESWPVPAACLDCGVLLLPWPCGSVQCNHAMLFYSIAMRALRAVSTRMPKVSQVVVVPSDKAVSLLNNLYL